MDEQANKSKSGRIVTQTEAGREYQANLKMKAFKRELQDLLKLGSQLVRHDGTSVETLPDITEEDVAKWFHVYISLGQTEQDLRHLLSEEEFKRHSETHIKKHGDSKSHQKCSRGVSESTEQDKSQASLSCWCINKIWIIQVSQVGSAAHAHPG